MTLRPTDMLVIQSAIDDYERKYPRRPAPSAEVALAWRLGKREAARVLARADEAKPAPEFAEQECGRFMWALEQAKLRLHMWTAPQDEPSERLENIEPWVRRLLLLGGWSAGAVVAASLFFFGALVGGFK